MELNIPKNITFTVTLKTMGKKTDGKIEAGDLVRTRTMTSRDPRRD